jgi:hypothetical protein
MTTATAPATRAPAPAHRRLRARHAWAIPGLAIAIYANSVSSQHDLGLFPLLLFGILPHLTVLLGIGQPHGRHRLAPRAVRAFNGMHHPVVPLVLAVVAATGAIGPFWLVGALAWLSHVVVDWALGDGLRGPDGELLGPVARLVGIGTPHRHAEEGSVSE